MGRRTRRRGGALLEGAPPEEQATRTAAPRRAPTAAAGRGAGPHHVTPDRRARLQEAPAPAWAPLPLTEVGIFAGLVLIILGFLSDGSRILLLGLGFGLVSVAATELALREHLAGYRSHSALLGAVAAIATVVVLRLGVLPLLDARVPQEALTIVGVVVFGTTLTALRRLFQRRAGGLGFRV